MTFVTSTIVALSVLLDTGSNRVTTQLTVGGRRPLVQKWNPGVTYVRHLDPGVDGYAGTPMAMTKMRVMATRAITVPKTMRSSARVDLPDVRVVWLHCVIRAPRVR